MTTLNPTLRWIAGHLEHLRRQTWRATSGMARRVALANRRRRTYRALAGLDGRTLHDIGLNRTGIIYASRKRRIGPGFQSRALPLGEG